MYVMHAVGLNVGLSNNALRSHNSVCSSMATWVQ